jgi:hypothetical protein
MARHDAAGKRAETLRLLLALAFLIVVGLALFRSPSFLPWLLVPAALFGGAVLYHTNVRRRLSRARRRADFYRAGLARIEDRWAGTGQRGEKFADPHHVYSADLDLFGEGSLFELLCVARTRMGEDALARWLLAPANREELPRRHAAAVEMRPRLDLREELAALGDQATPVVNVDALLAWTSSPDRLQQKWIVWAVRGMAAAFVAAAAAWYFTGLLSPVLLVLAIEAASAYALKRQLRETIGAAESAFANVDVLADFLAILERQQFSAPWLLERVQSLRSHNLEAARAIAALR